MIVRRIPWGQFKPLLGYGLNYQDRINNGLTSCFLMNESRGQLVFDLTRKYTGSFVSGPVWTGGKFGPGVQMDGSASYIDFGLENPKPTAISYSIWVKPIAIGSAYNTVMSVNLGGGYHQFFIKSNGKLAAYCSNTTDSNYDGTGVFTLVVGRWYHLAMTYDSVAGLVGYVNGVVDGTAAANGVLSISTGNLQIGNDQNFAGTRLLNAVVENARVYNRAITKAEVLRLYQEPFAGILGRRQYLPIATPAAVVGGFKPYWASQRSRVIGAGVI